MTDFRGGFNAYRRTHVKYSASNEKLDTQFQKRLVGKNQQEESVTGLCLFGRKMLRQGGLARIICANPVQSHRLVASDFILADDRRHGCLDLAQMGFHRGTGFGFRSSLNGLDNTAMLDI